MKRILFILFWLISVSVYPATYYVAITGSDAAAGTIDAPWKTWGKAFNDPIVDPGDTIYFRGGVYYRDYTTEYSANPSWFTAGNGYRFQNEGIFGSLIYYLNYPGETPILDDSNVPSTSTLHIMINGATSYCYFKGLQFRNCWQDDGGVQAVIWRGIGGNVTIENCKAYNVHGIGFQVWGDYANTRFINCDAYNCCDSLDASTPGNRGTGFAIVNNAGNTGSVYYENCRAWNCGDQGFSCFSLAYMEFNGCWSFLNGQMLGGGHGFKIGFAPSTGNLAPLLRKMTNCIATYNRASGITTNDNSLRAVSCQIYNNIAYRNYDFSNDYAYSTRGIFIYNTVSNDDAELTRVFRNNISFGNTVNNGDSDIGVSTGALYTHSNNSWDASVTINNADFVSVDTTGITGARQADGSLPNNACYNNFLHLAATSDLINAGIDVGLDYDGDAPDLGAYEFEGFADEPSAPYISTTIPYAITTTRAFSGGYMISDGGAEITAKGVCYSTSPNPTTADNTVSGGTGTDPFTSQITGLSIGITYNVRAYATNSVGTTYGVNENFTTSQSSIIKHGGKIVKR
jgi:hypothetical protein